MYKTHEKFQNTLILTASKFFGFCLTIAIPVFLSRWLTIENYGTYKQIILIWMLFLQIQNFGMDLGLFYFVKTHPDKSPVFSLNVVIFNFLTTLVTVSCLNIWPSSLANLMNNPDLIEYIPQISALLLFSIPAQHFEHYLITLDKIKWTVVLEITHEILKSSAIIAGFLFFNSLKVVLLFLSSIYLLKLFVLLIFNYKLLKKNYVGLSDFLTSMTEQIKYGAPIGIARVISTFVYFDRFIISSLFSLKKFTIYAVGCFEIPFVGTVLNTIWDLSSMEMVTARRAKKQDQVVQLWNDTYRKIALISIPIFSFCLFFGGEIITLLFSKQYESSVPYFKLFMFSFLIYSFDSELLFRVYGDNFNYLKIQIYSLVLTVTLMVSLGVLYGPLWALAGKVIASTLTLTMMMNKARKLLDISTRKILPWSTIALILLSSTSTAYLSHKLVSSTTLADIYKLAIAGSIYSPILICLFALMGIISQEEQEYIKGKFLLMKGLSKRLIYRGAQ